MEQVRSYVASHAVLASDLARVQREMDEAAKKAREEARSKNRRGPDKNKAGKGADTAASDAKKDVQPTAPPPPATMSLFEQADSEKTNVPRTAGGTKNAEVQTSSSPAPGSAESDDDDEGGRR